MKPRYERPGVPDGSTFTCYVRRERAFGFEWHFHQEYELTLITAGSGTRYVGTIVERYQPGDLVLLGPELPHTYASEPLEPLEPLEPTGPPEPAGVFAEASVTQFRHDFLGVGFFEHPQFRRVGELLARSAQGLWFHDAGVRELVAALPRLEPATQTVRLLDILCQLAADTTATPITGPGYTSAPSTMVRDRVDIVCRELQLRHTEAVTQEEIAALVHMPPTSFSRFFRRALGCTFTEYVNQLRIETACRLLTDTALPITEVATRSGYHNLSNFNRRFLELKHLRPTAYRAAHPPLAPVGRLR
ncbi:AraC family transcriptional regulator [Kribbella solani]|uniref:AraC family transcriptional regulator n=1 Tax=Kribbella solani TaxID=236067 RepID=UPI0029A50968|nr:AraC family transcriptional regulator [Kribbella solani]MDX3001743.1 AraC family transcriptional regulator [Kribbella solani]